MQIDIKTIISFLAVAFSNPVASLRTQVRTLKSCNLCPDSSLRSRMTGKYLIPFIKNYNFFFLAYFCG